jgi:hypothetical protein
MKNSRSLILIDDVKEVGRGLASVRPHINLEVPASGLSGIQTPGTKCEHGMYIPATSPWPDNAPYCSICRPFLIAVRKGGIFKA